MSDFPANTSWKDVRCSTLVECSGAALEKLRRASVEGLLALPRVGMGVGGLLLGSYRRGSIQIKNTVEIPCAHANGPSFGLSPEEIAAARELMSAAKTPVVGWYCSKTKGPPVLGEKEIALFRALCPEAWQVMLLLRPSTVEASRAVLFFRDSDGGVLAGQEQEIDRVQELVSVQTIEAEQETGPPEPSIKSLPVLPDVVATIVPDVVPVFLEEPQDLREMKQVAIPRFLTQEPVPAGRAKWLVWALAAALLSLGGTTAWVTRDSWIPRPPLTLAVTDTKGHMNIRWNPDAVRGISAGLLSIVDGGEAHRYQLDGHSLATGAMGYDRKSPRVTAMLRVGEARVIASFLDPVPPPPPAVAPVIKGIRKKRAAVPPAEASPVN